MLFSDVLRSAVAPALCVQVWVLPRLARRVVRSGATGEEGSRVRYGTTIGTVDGHVARQDRLPPPESKGWGGQGRVRATSCGLPAPSLHTVVQGRTVS
jgi:hypothetical protein